MVVIVGLIVSLVLWRIRRQDAHYKLMHSKPGRYWRPLRLSICSLSGIFQNDNSYALSHRKCGQRHLWLRLLLTPDRLNAATRLTLLLVGEERNRCCAWASLNFGNWLNRRGHQWRCPRTRWGRAHLTETCSVRGTFSYLQFIPRVCLGTSKIFKNFFCIIES